MNSFTFYGTLVDAASVSESAQFDDPVITSAQDPIPFSTLPEWRTARVPASFWLAVLLGCIALWFFTFPAHAVTYAYRNDVFSFDTPSATATTVIWHAGTDGNWLGSPACTSFPNGDDDFADITFPAGFRFTFGDVTYLGVRIYSNGMLAFGNDVSGFHRDYTSQALPITAAGSPSGNAPCVNAVPSKLMIPYWVDIIAGSATGITGAAVKYEVLTDPATSQRRMVITWQNVALYGNAATRYSFQVHLYESAGGLNGNFEYQYTVGATTGNPGTVGVQLSSTDFTQYSFNQAFIDPIAGTAILWYPANQLAAKGAEYRFDESNWVGAAGEIKDTSGGNKHASRVGAVTNVLGGKLCRGGNFTANTSNTTIDAVATPIVPVSVGSVDFWYQSVRAWNAASSDAMLFDASSTAARPFFLMKRANGKLRFVLTDSAGVVRTAETSTSYTFAANTWHHVGVSWNLKPGTNQTVQQIFVDGTLANTTTSTPFRSTTSGTLATVSTLYIGDNRTSGITPSTGTPNGANGVIDEFYIYSLDISAAQAAADMALTRANCTNTTLDHFHLSHAGSVVNCGGDIAHVTLEAHDANHALFPLAGTTVNLATSTAHGTWTNVLGGAINPVVSSGNGAGSYTFSNESSIVLGLSNTWVEALNINLAAGTVTENSGAAASCVAQDYTFGATCDADVSFDLAGFRFVNNVGNPINHQIAGTTSGTFYLQAVQNSCTTPGSCTGVCTAVFPAGTAVNIGLASECKNPIACAGKQITLAAAGTSNPNLGVIGANDAGTVSESTGTYTTHSVTFNASGMGIPTPAVPFTLNYPDVGQMVLWARYPASVTGNNISGSSAPFVVKPAGFTLSAIQQTAAPSLVNPAAADAAGAKFIPAGAAFSATVTAVTSAGVATPNFGKENPAEQVSLTPALVTGLGLTQNPAVLGGFAVFNNGVATGTAFSWDEVGIITLTPNLLDGNYLGAGTVTGTTSGKVGRFYPAQFVLSNGLVTNRADLCPNLPVAQPAGCPASFSYMDERMHASMTLTAQSVSGAVTQNYQGAFAKLNPAALGNPLSLAAANFASGTAVLTSRLNLSTAGTGAFALGVADINLPFALGRGAFADGAFNAVGIGIAPVDSDGVALNSYDLDMDVIAGFDHRKVGVNTSVRYGRIRLSNGYGSTLYPLTLQADAQYWNGGVYANAIDDDLTRFTVGNVVLSNYAKNLNAGETCVSPPACATSKIYTFASGIVRYQLKAPGIDATGQNNNGSVDLQLNSPGYLPSTTSRATFGVYKGSQDFIYMREVY